MFVAAQPGPSELQAASNSPSQMSKPMLSWWRWNCVSLPPLQFQSQRGLYTLVVVLVSMAGSLEGLGCKPFTGVPAVTLHTSVVRELSQTKTPTRRQTPVLPTTQG